MAPVLSDENHQELLTQATHKSKREVEELLARVRPQPDVPVQVRKLPGSKRPTPGVEPEPRAGFPPKSAGVESAADAATPGGTAAPVTPVAAPAPHSPARPATVVVPLAPERYKVQFTVSAATREKMRRAQELLRHRIPDDDVAAVIDLALDLLVRDLEKKKFAATERPRPSARGAERVREFGGALPSAPPRPSSLQPSPAPSSATRPSRYIPAAVKRAVWARDQGCCAFVSSKGDRCRERGGLEFDHVRPHADGGSATADNVRLLCRRHNQYESQQFYGLWQSDGTYESIPRCN